MRMNGQNLRCLFKAAGLHAEAVRLREDVAKPLVESALGFGELVFLCFSLNLQKIENLSIAVKVNQSLGGR